MVPMTAPDAPALLPWALLPGSGAWADRLEALAASPDPLWIHGPAGSGVSTLARFLAERRGSALLDEAQELPAEALGPWLADHPRGVIGAHAPCPLPGRALELRLQGLDEAPEALPGLLRALGPAEGPAPPGALGALPCPGNLRELRTRVVRWSLLGQLPERPPAALPAFEAEDLATNLHALEAFLLHRALRRSYGNRVEAARRLGVSRRHLYLLVARHGDPVRGEAPTAAPPKRLTRVQNASRGKGTR